MKFLLALIVTTSVWSNPYPDPQKVDSPQIPSRSYFTSSKKVRPRSGSDVLRVEVTWSQDEKYEVSGLYLEKSGTPALMERAQKKDPLGSYKARLILSDQTILHGSVGTGKEFRKLALTMSFRFPLVSNLSSASFILEAEHPQKGNLEKVLTKKLNLSLAKQIHAQKVDVELLRPALKSPALKVNFYAEGYQQSGEQKFLATCRKAIATLEKHLPGSEYFEFRAVFAPSKVKIGRHQDLGPKPLPRDSFLGLYFPHWHKFGRWYHVVYATDQTQYRNALAQVDYDYPIAIVDDSGYWGVGNYKELTAIPSDNYQFSYLLLHEFGHFMGLNEEYEGGGPTELEFAPGINEPWSQNITFHPHAESLKWYKFTEPGIPLPTSKADYIRHGGMLKNPVGAYRGGYADSEPQKKSHKPVLKCMMGTGGDFCPVCSEALSSLVDFDRRK